MEFQIGYFFLASFFDCVTNEKEEALNDEDTLFFPKSLVYSK